VGLVGEEFVDIHHAAFSRSSVDSESTGRGKKSLEVLIDTETEASLQRDLYPSVSYIFYSQKGLGLNNAPLTTSLVLSSGPPFLPCPPIPPEFSNMSFCCDLAKCHNTTQ
jgi:hypothetical protein